MNIFMDFAMSCHITNRISSVFNILCNIWIYLFHRDLLSIECYFSKMFNNFYFLIILFPDNPVWSWLSVPSFWVYLDYSISQPDNFSLNNEQLNLYCELENDIQSFIASCFYLLTHHNRQHIVDYGLIEFQSNKVQF